MAANLQDLNWNDIQMFLATVAQGSFAAAGTAVGSHETTVARGVSRLERALGQTVFLRPQMVLTPFGEELCHALNGTTQIMNGVAALARRHGAPAGPVRVAAVPWIVNEVLIPLSGRLLANYPDLDLALVASATRTDAATGEADLVLRFARPDGAVSLLTRRLATVAFGEYAISSAADWVGYDRVSQDLPQVGWVTGTVAVRVVDIASALASVRAGLGRAHLPICIGPPDLLRGQGDWQREVWMLRHPARRNDPAVDAVIGWLDHVVAPVLSGIAPDIWRA